MPAHFPPPVISPALAAAINAVPDPALRDKVDILVAKTTRALAAARTIHFVGYEDRELHDHSLELWNELAPIFGAVFKELRALTDSIEQLFAKPAAPPSATEEKDFDLAFDLVEAGDQHPITGRTVVKTPLDTVTELAHSYAWIIKQAVMQEVKKLREPSLMQQQWNLLGELEEFRDRMVAAMHAMVVAILNVFDDVEVEAVFPLAYETTEMGVAIRRHVADLAAYAENSLASLAPGVADVTLRRILSDVDERTALLLKLPSIGSLRASDRHELATFRRHAAQLRAAAPNRVQVKQLLDGHSKFLSSLHSVDLKERLQAHDREVAQEALLAIRGALTNGATNPTQALMFVAHAVRRVSRLYGVNPDLDHAARTLKDTAGGGLEFARLEPVLQDMLRAITPLTS
jgi:hypothetical protein